MFGFLDLDSLVEESSVLASIVIIDKHGSLTFGFTSPKTIPSIFSSSSSHRECKRLFTLSIDEKASLVNLLHGVDSE